MRRVTRGLHRYRRELQEAKHRAILDAAMDAFLTDGYTGSSMAKIARKADVSTATLYAHVGSKKELFSEVIVRAYQALDSAASSVTDSMNASDALFYVLRAIVEQHYANNTNGLLRMAWPEITTAPQLAVEMYQQGTVARHELLTKMLDHYVARKELKPHDTVLGANQLAGMVKECLVWPGLFDLEFKLPTVSDSVIREAVNTFMARHGV